MLDVVHTGMFLTEGKLFSIQGKHWKKSGCTQCLLRVCPRMTAVGAHHSVCCLHEEENGDNGHFHLTQGGSFSLREQREG